MTLYELLLKKNKTLRSTGEPKRAYTSTSHSCSYYTCNDEFYNNISFFAQLLANVLSAGSFILLILILANPPYLLESSVGSEQSTESSRTFGPRAHVNSLIHSVIPM